jgi:sugar phosphate isomerase/epimerase
MHRINLNSVREEERIEYVEQIKGYLAEAVSMGAEIFTVLSGPDPGPARREAAKECLVASLNEICRFAAAKDYALTVTLESFDRGIDKRCLIGPSNEALEIAREVIGSGFQNFGLTLDQGHLPLLGEDPAYAISKTLPFLSHLHLGNCIKDYPDHPLYGDHHPRYGLTGCCLELNDLVKLLHILDSHSFWREKQHEGDKPIISFEVKPAPGESSLDTLQKVKETWCHAWELYRQGKSQHCL